MYKSDYYEDEWEDVGFYPLDDFGLLDEDEDEDEYPDEDLDYQDDECPW